MTDYEAVYYCSCCDHNIVDRRKPETGKFYVVHGNTNDRSQGKDWCGEYKSVGFAICHECNASKYLESRVLKCDDHPFVAEINS